MSEEWILEYELAANKIKLAVIGLCEIRKPGEGIIECENKNVLAFIGGTKGQRGVGFLISERYSSC